MDYIKNTFTNLAKQAGGMASTKQSDLFWTYSAGGIPLVTYGLLAATTLVLAAGTLSMSGGAKTEDNKDASDTEPPAEQPAAAPVPETKPEPASEPVGEQPATDSTGQGGKRKKGKSNKNKKSKKSKTTKRRK